MYCIYLTIKAWVIERPAVPGVKSSLSTITKMITIKTMKLPKNSTINVIHLKPSNKHLNMKFYRFCSI